MNASEFLKAVDHAAGMNDRWLFLAAFCLLLEQQIGRLLGLLFAGFVMLRDEGGKQRLCALIKPGATISLIAPPR